MIFAAGMGTRLKPLTDTTPKALIPIAGKTLLEHILLKLKLAGFTQIMVNVHHFSDQIIDFLKQNNNFGLQIEISNERETLLDTGGGLRKVQDFFKDEPFLAHNVDILSNINLKELMHSHKSGDLATLVVSERETARYLLFDNAGKLHGWTNIKTQEIKPPALCTEGLQRFAFSGIQVLSPRIFEQMNDFPDKFSMIEVYLKSMLTNEIRAYIPTDLRMMDVGKIDTIGEAENFIFR